MTALAAGMLTSAPEHTLSWPYIHEEWDEGLVKQIGRGLAATADGFRIDLQSSSFVQLRAPFEQIFEVSRRACSPPRACTPLPPLVQPRSPLQGTAPCPPTFSFAL